MKQFIKDYFTFNKRQRSGVLVLLAIILTELIYLQFSYLISANNVTDFSQFDKEISLFNKSLDSIKLSEKMMKTTKKTFSKKQQYFKDTIQINYFKFDPNGLPESDWAKLGLSKKQISSIKNYENKGGKFKTKDDVKKMYCISDKQYQLLEPYIAIEQDEIKINNKKKEDNKTTPKKIEIIELNTADSALLTSIRGIGPFYAKNIIKHRNELGGYYKQEQLLEIWKFDSLKLENIKPYISIDTSFIKKININRCTAEELKHYYLKWNMVNVIINYRAKHGIYKAIEEIKKTDLVDEQTYRKIAPYLTVQ
jgi:DNA uptake protein ComE-like DNA-binding protein